MPDPAGRYDDNRVLFPLMLFFSYFIKVDDLAFEFFYCDILGLVSCFCIMIRRWRCVSVFLVRVLGCATRLMPAVVLKRVYEKIKMCQKHFKRAP